jgi:pilus assembly protein CpaC
MTRFTLRLAALLLAIAGAATLAPASAGAAPKPKIIAADGSLTLSIAVGRGELVHLAQPAQSVFVADPDVADVQIKSPNLVFLLGKASGETTLFAVSDDDQVVMSANVQVHYDMARVSETIHKVAPHSAVSVTTVDDALVLRGTVYSAAEAEDIRRVAARFVPDAALLMNKLKVDQPNQIQLRVRVCEVTRNVVKQLGFNWDTLVNSGHFLFGLATGRAVVANPSVPAAATTFLTRTLSPPQDSILGAFNTGNASVNTAIDALDEAGLLTVLAQPNLTAISGQPASFLAGGEFPVPVPSVSTGGIPTIAIGWKQFGVSLTFVATILENNRISIHVQPEVSQLSTQGEVQIAGITVPALATRRAETTIELGSGESFAIAGLIQNNINQTIDRFPWLGDIPVLGTLFRSQSFKRGEDELVIIVTPYVVRPVSTADALQAPTDGFQPSSDKQLLLEGADQKTQVLKRGAAPVGASGNGLIGPVGFELE